MCSTGIFLFHFSVGLLFTVGSTICWSSVCIGCTFITENFFHIKMNIYAIHWFRHMQHSTAIHPSIRPYKQRNVDASTAHPIYMLETIFVVNRSVSAITLFSSVLLTLERNSPERQMDVCVCSARSVLKHILLNWLGFNAITAFFSSHTFFHNNNYLILSWVCSRLYWDVKQFGKCVCVQLPHLSECTHFTGSAYEMHILLMVCARLGVYNKHQMIHEAMSYKV